MLAGTDRLDKELMIGQMQGKFQMIVVPGVGHMLHEVLTFLGQLWRFLQSKHRFAFVQDDPTQLAQILLDFWRRNDRILPKGIKKVGDV